VRLLTHGDEAFVTVDSPVTHLLLPLIAGTEYDRAQFHGVQSRGPITQRRAGREEGRAMGKHVRACDLDIWTEQAGEGPDVLLIGGLGDTVESWQFQLDGLADR